MSDLSQLYNNQNNPFTLYLKNIVVKNNLETSNDISFPTEIIQNAIPPNNNPQPVNVAIIDNFGSTPAETAIFQSCFAYMKGDPTLQTITQSSTPTKVVFNNVSTLNLNILGENTTTVSTKINGMYRVYYSVNVSYPVGDSILSIACSLNCNNSYYSLIFLDNPLGNSGQPGSEVINGMAIVVANQATTGVLNDFSIEVIGNMTANNFSISSPELCIELISPA